MWYISLTLKTMDSALKKWLVTSLAQRVGNSETETGLEMVAF